jgi:hypothetical protein
MSRRFTAGRSRLRLFHLSVACLSAILCSTAFASSALADVTEVTGSAFGESVDVKLLNAVPVTSGPLPSVTMTSPPGGLGPFSQSALSASVPGLLTAGVLNASTQGGNLGSHAGFATSSASVANVNALLGRITATVIGSTCKSNGDGSTGSSTLTNLNVLGVAVNAATAPNTTITLPTVGRVIINEQIRPTNGPTTTSIIVRAIHVELDGILGSGDVIIAESRCGAKGPDVVPVAPIGLLGVTALLGLGFAGMQWKNRRDGRSVAASTH